MKLEDIARMQLETIINSYRIVSDKEKKKVIIDPVLDEYLDIMGFEYKGRKRTCDYYQKGNQVFVRKRKPIKLKIVTKKGIKKIKRNKFDYVSCFLDPKNFKEFKKLFDAKVHNLPYGRLPQGVRTLMDMGCGAVCGVLGYLLSNSFLIGYAAGIGGVISGSKISNKLSDKRYSKGQLKMVSFNQWYKDYIFFDKAALEKLLK